MAVEDLIALKASPPPVSLIEAEHTARALYGLDGRAMPLHGERDRNVSAPDARR